jgi:D-alanyl-lipoteichoic acid acyltransferase DltB (MBOAT superfamily)
LVLLPLFFFKYFNFVNESIFSLLALCGIESTVPAIKWMLPVGISFYTFMAIGYLIDVNNEEVDVEKNIGAVGLFLSFFPYILSGPIERAGNMFPQLKKMPTSQPADLTAGLKLMLWGYFMKLCVADRLGIYVDAVFNNFAHHNGTTLTLATLLYPIQVYGDLGGYSLIAIGAAHCMGMKIIPNFNRPFFATSMSELWRRWHMSLINWLTDYIYTPLSFALRSWKVWGIVCALMLTFLISGIWHGAALTFIVWGFVQGFYLSIEALLQKRRSTFESKHKLTKRWWYILICCVVVYLLFAFSQIFGRCATVSDAFEVIGKIFGERGSLFVDISTLIYALSFTFVLIVKDFCDEFFAKKITVFENKHIVIRFLGYLITILLVLYAGVLDGGSFIYFQF